jgi:hypothetical protein
MIQFMRFYQRRLMMKDISISYHELGAVLAAGVGISYLASFLVNKESLVDTAVDVMATAGTYLVGKAAYQVSKGLRETFISPPNATNTPNTDSTSSKVKKRA